MAALVAVYEAAFKDYSNRLAPGEVGGNILTPFLRCQSRRIVGYLPPRFGTKWKLIEFRPSLAPSWVVLLKDRYEAIAVSWFN